MFSPRMTDSDREHRQVDRHRQYTLTRRDLFVTSYRPTSLSHYCRHRRDGFCENRRLPTHTSNTWPNCPSKRLSIGYIVEAAGWPRSAWLL